MTAPEQVASTAQEQAGAVAGTAKEQAASVAHTATSAAGEVTGTAKEQAGAVVEETVAQAKDLTGQVRQQAAQQVSAQSQRATTALRDLSRQLSEGDTSGVVGSVLGEVGQRVQGLADALERKGPQGVVDDLRRYARRNPGTFVLGAALAGLVTGRLVKGMSATPEQPALPTGRDTYPLAAQAVPATTYGTPAAGTYAGTSADDEAYGATTYGTGVPASGAYGTGAPPYGTDADLAAPYPGTGSAEPYRTGYAPDEPYGTRGTL